MTVIRIVIGALVTRPETLRNNRTSGDYPNYSIVKVGQNTAKSPGDLRRLLLKLR